MKKLIIYIVTLILVCILVSCSTLYPKMQTIVRNDSIIWIIK